jgi:hypothetical protein
MSGIAGCCARAASGHAAAPPSRVMKSRRSSLSLGTGAAEAPQGSGTFVFTRALCPPRATC